MAPKSKKKSAAAKRKEMEELAQQEQLAAEDEYEFEKACLEIRVKELETLNLGLQRKSEYLESQNDVFKAQLEDLKEEKEDLVAHLERCFSEARTNARELEDRLYGTYQARQDDKKAFEAQLLQKNKDLEELRESLEKKILEAEAKLTALEEFRVQRDNLTEEKDQLKKTLEEERSRFARNYDELENNLVRYREKIKNDSVTMIKKMACDIQEAGKLCLTATVKEAISANIRLQDELEATSKENLDLGEKLEKLKKSHRDKRMTLEVVEKENSVLHKKCLQYRLMTQELLDKYMLLQRRLEALMTIEDELTDLKAIHSTCLSEDQIEQRITDTVEKVLESRKEKLEVEKKSLTKEDSTTFSSSTKLDSEADPQHLEMVKLKDAILKMAIASKELSQAENLEELEFFKDRFKVMVKHVFHTACEISDLPPEMREALKNPVPAVTDYISFK